jgi:methanogenic corrinoid protein MtbC1
MWEQATCSVAQEHFASAFVREKLVAMLDSMSGVHSSGPEAICVGAPGEVHEFGLVAAAIHLSLRGWRVTYLGADLPLAEIESVAHERRPALLCTSIVRARSRAECLLLAAALRSVAPDDTIVAIGGRGLPDPLFALRSEGVHFLRTIPELFELAE